MERGKKSVTLEMNNEKNEVCEQRVETESATSHIIDDAQTFVEKRLASSDVSEAAFRGKQPES